MFLKKKVDKSMCLFGVVGFRNICIAYTCMDTLVCFIVNMRLHFNGD